MNKTRWIIAFLSVLFTITFIVGCQYGKMRSEGSGTADTVFEKKVDTIWKDTTITRTKYIPKKVEVIKTDTITNDTILNVEQKTYQDTLCNGKDSIILTSTISGINSNLDSTSVVWKKQKEIITQTITVTKYIEKPKTFWDRVHLQPQFTIGFDPINKNFGAVIGLGVGVDI